MLISLLGIGIDIVAYLSKFVGPFFFGWFGSYQTLRVPNTDSIRTFSTVTQFKEGIYNFSSNKIDIQTFKSLQNEVEILKKQIQNVQKKLEQIYKSK